MVNRIYVKICGLTTREAVDAASDAGADAVGVVLSPSPRQLDSEQAKKLIGLVPPSTATVVVTRQPPDDFVSSVLTELAPAWWQSDRDDLVGKTLPAGIRALPVIRVGEDVSTLPQWFVYEGVQSGAGNKVDWNNAATLARRGRLILAGVWMPIMWARQYIKLNPMA